MKLRLLPLGPLVGMALLVGCSGDDGQPSNAADQQNEATAEGSDSAEQGGTSTAGVEAADLEDVVVEQTVALPESPDDKGVLGVQSLTVEGQVMVLRLVVTPQFTSESQSESISLFAAMGGHSFRPRLIDGVNLKEYEPISGEGRVWSSGDLDVEAVNGSPMLAWAYFAAPEDPIETIDVRVSDVWPAFTDIPITR